MTGSFVARARVVCDSRCRLWNIRFLQLRGDTEVPANVVIAYHTPKMHIMMRAKPNNRKGRVQARTVSGVLYHCSPITSSLRAPC